MLPFFYFVGMKCEICKKDGAVRVNLLFDEALISNPEVAGFARLAVNHASLCSRCQKLKYELRFFYAYLKLKKVVGHTNAIIALNRFARHVSKYDSHIKPIDFRRLPALSRRWERYVEKTVQKV